MLSGRKKYFQKCTFHFTINNGNAVKIYFVGPGQIGERKTWYIFHSF